MNKEDIIESIKLINEVKNLFEKVGDIKEKSIEGDFSETLELTNYVRNMLREIIGSEMVQKIEWNFAELEENEED